MHDPLIYRKNGRYVSDVIPSRKMVIECKKNMNANTDITDVYHRIGIYINIEKTVHDISVQHLADEINLRSKTNISRLCQTFVAHMK